MIVVDANIVISLVYRMAGTESARAVHAQDDLWLVPSLWRYEVLNALLNLFRSGCFDLASAEAMWRIADELLDSGVRAVDPVETLSTAQATRLTAYDATYVVLARSLGVLLVTEDKQILRACPDVARSMKQFLSPPEAPLAVREKPATYKTRRAGKRGGP